MMEHQGCCIDEEMAYVMNDQGPRGEGNGGHAIVIGGSMIGLLAARMLVDHFDQVTILERDHFPGGPEARKGVPQAHHPHVLLVRGRAILERFFPNLAHELVSHGGRWFDYAEDGLLRIGGRRLPRFRSGVMTISCSRALLEWCVRRRIAAYPRIHIYEDMRVTRLVADHGKTRILGVRVRHRGPDRAPAFEQALYADLVVDASGRGSQAPEWLERLGYGRPTETVITPFLGYATRHYQCASGTEEGWKVVGLATEYPHNPRGAAMLRVEHDRLLVTLVGTAKHYPPTSEADFLTFARQLPDPVVYKTIQHAVPLSPIRGYRATENRLRRFERLARWPERFVVVGDAVCSFNPIYAQGLTVGALGVVELEACLRRQRRRHPDGNLTGLARRFQKRIARRNRLPWMMATVEDLRWPTTLGRRPTWQNKLTYWYMRGLFAVMAERPAVTRTFLQVMHMVKPPAALFKPDILLQVLHRAALQQAQAGRGAPVAALSAYGRREDG